MDFDYVTQISLLLQAQGVKKVIVGGALGWDTLFARAALISQVPYHLFIPFEGQDKKWPDVAKARYKIMREKAEEVTIVSPGGYAAWKMQKRNQVMVDAAKEVWALWDGENGGTKNCITYAILKRKPILNFFLKENETRLYEIWTTTTT